MPVPPAILAYGTTPAPDHAPDPQPVNVLDTLYTAALGPTGSAHYQPLFTHFGTLGRTRTAWNSAAALFTVAWLVYRKLWSVALAYVMLMEGIAIAWFIGIRPSLPLPLPVEAGLALAWLTVSMAMPGLWGDALVYNDVHKRTMRALEAAPTLAQARSELVREAPTRRRLYTLAALQALVIVATLAALLWPSVFTPPAGASTKPAAALSPAPLPTADEVLASMALAPGASSGEAQAPSPTDVTTPSVHNSAQPLESAAAPATPAPEDNASPSAPSPPAGETSAALASSVSPVAVVPPPEPGTATDAGQRSATKPTPRSTPVPAAAGDQVRQTLESKRYYVNVGVFADEANAQKVQRQLQRSKLPLVVHTVGTNKGDRIRVRAGPFSSAAKAKAAASQVKALGLEAMVFQHP
jgi:cell division septation protein DedD